jgi:hypothetical protein
LRCTPVSDALIVLRNQAIKPLLAAARPLVFIASRVGDAEGDIPDMSMVFRDKHPQVTL